MECIKSDFNAIINHNWFSFGRSYLNVGGDVVDPASSLVIKDQKSLI